VGFRTSPKVLGFFCSDLQETFSIVFRIFLHWFSELLQRFYGCSQVGLRAYLQFLTQPENIMSHL
jgi:hypothetical protein